MSPTMRRASRAAVYLAFAAAGALSLFQAPAVSAAPDAPPVGTGWYQIKVRHSGMCLDVAHRSFAAAAPVVVATCGSGHNQQWRLLSQGEDKFKIKARHSGMCLDVAWGSTAHAARVVQSHCNGGSNQVWWFVQAPGRAPLVNSSIGVVPQVGNSVGIVADHSGALLDVAHFSRAHGAPVVQAHASGGGPTTNQQWRFVQASP
ncbi:RICIN domain-containing protein [Streptomyces sp. NPDC048266]|uniref:RICIN domain-containing protein n=1 Tax=Streptomyces sp. NPDC048266 TaxID=3155787 RepID=UPI0033D3DC65